MTVCAATSLQASSHPGRTNRHLSQRSCRAHSHFIGQKLGSLDAKPVRDSALPHSAPSSLCPSTWTREQTRKSSILHSALKHGRRVSCGASATTPKGGMKITDELRAILHQAANLVDEHGDRMIGVYHLLHAMATEPDSAAAGLLKSCGVDVDAVKLCAEEYMGCQISSSSGPAASHSEVAGKKLTAGAEELLFMKAATLQKVLKDTQLSSEHVLYGLIDTKVGEALGEKFHLKESGIHAHLAARMLTSAMAAEIQGPQGGYLKKYTNDLTELARKGDLDKVLCRGSEARRCIHILSRRTKKNAVLVGEPGVGKTAVVNAIAQRIVSGRVPETFKNCSVVSLDIGKLMSDCQYHGQFEKALKGVIAEAGESEQRTILFMDELHALATAKPGQGSMGAADVLKEPLSRGTVQCIAATTVTEYRKFIEADAAFERRFQKVLVEEPTIDETVTMLRGLLPKMVKHHAVRITDDAVAAAARLSSRYIADRFLPDKAIDVLDEAAAQLFAEHSGMPADYDAARDKWETLCIETSSLRQSGGEKQGIVNEHHESLSKAHAVFQALEEDHKRFMADRMELKELKEQLHMVSDGQNEELQKQTHLLENSSLDGGGQGDGTGGCDLVGDHHDQLQAEYKKKELEMRSKWPNKWQITEDNVAAVVSQWTGIPVEKLVRSEKARLLQLPDTLQQRVLGQEEAVQKVAESVKMSRAGLLDPRRPTASLMFCGPTGVGKTELCKALAEAVFGSEDAMVRIDMSEFMERHNAARLVGAPPGYIGHGEGGQLTEAVRAKPYSLVLFDEVEKAHQDVFNLLLQILDDGHITDSQGRLVSFRNTIVIMTSNLGSTHHSQSDSSGKDRVMEAVRGHFRPEFVNRVDDFIVFKPLGKPEIAEIVRLQVSEVAARLKAEHSMQLQLSKEALEFLAEQGFDPAYGARPVRRAVRQELQRPLADCLLTGQFTANSTVHVGAARRVVLEEESGMMLAQKWLTFNESIDDGDSE